MIRTFCYACIICHSSGLVLKELCKQEMLHKFNLWSHAALRFFYYWVVNFGSLVKKNIVNKWKIFIPGILALINYVPNPSPMIMKCFAHVHDLLCLQYVVYSSHIFWKSPLNHRWIISRKHLCFVSLISCKDFTSIIRSYVQLMMLKP